MGVTVNFAKPNPCRCEFIRTAAAGIDPERMNLHLHVHVED